MGWTSVHILMFLLIPGSYGGIEKSVNLLPSSLFWLHFVVYEKIKKMTIFKKQELLVR